MTGSGSVPRSTRRSRSVPWDWTDVAIFVPAAIVVSPFGDLLFDGLARLLDAGASSAVRDAVQSAADATGVYVAWLCVVLGLVIWRRRGSPADLGWRRPRVWWLLLIFPIAGAMLVGALYLAELSSWLFPHLSSGQCQTVRQEFGHIVPVAILLVSVIDPLAEETVFRGFIHGWLRSRLPRGLAVLLSAAIFSAAHVEPLLFLPLLGVGAVLALSYDLSGSLLVSASVHGLFNAYNVIAILNAPSC